MNDKPWGMDRLVFLRRISSRKLEQDLLPSWVVRLELHAVRCVSMVSDAQSTAVRTSVKSYACRAK